MAKRKEVEKSMLTEVSKKIKKDNKTVDELIDKIMKEVEVWVKTHKKDWDELSIEDQSTLTEPNYLVRKVSEIKYTQSSLRKIIYGNLKRATGNLAEEQRIVGIYETLAKFGYQCPYSDTLLIGGEQKIHIDHIIPVTMGGPTDDWNCIPVCASCNTSKNDRHLLDWWQENRTQQEEFKLVKIFEHMTSKLLDETNEIHYLETEDKTKHLDAITFLNQLYDHIEENKEYIFEFTFQSEKEKTKATEKKLKELKSTLEKVTKKNNKNTKTDKQHFAEMREMVKFVKSLGVRSYYKIAYTYFAEIQEMRNLGKTQEVIRKFCFDRDDRFNFTQFYEKLKQYKKNFGDCLVPRGYVCDDGYHLGNTVDNIRHARTRISDLEIQKLNCLGFVWLASGFDVDNVRVELKKFVEDFNLFINQNKRRPKGYDKPIDNDKKKENNLYNKWLIYRRTENLYERQYLQENIVLLPNESIVLQSKEINIHLESDNVRESLKIFVDKFNMFVIENKRYPRCYQKPIDKEQEDEKNLYHLWRKYRNPENLEHANEIQYIQENLIKIPKVRECVKSFVEKFNTFIIENKREPSPSTQKGTEQEKLDEKNLYFLWRKYRNPENLKHDDEIQYIQENLVKASKDSIREAVKTFVEDFNKFVLENKRYPLCYKNPTDKTSIYERNLYNRWIVYRNPENLENEEEIQYIDKNLIKENVREILKQFVDEFNLFVLEHKRIPTSVKDTTTSEKRDERNLYQKWYQYRNLANLENEDEIRYIQENLIKLPQIRVEVKEFVEKFNKFVADNKRQPSSSPKNPEERNLYKQWKKYTQAKNLKHQDEIDYLQDNGISITGLEEYLIEETKNEDVVSV